VEIMAVQSFRQILGAQPSKVSTSSSVLIIIDAQNEYAEGHLKVHNVDASRKIISSLLQKYRSSSAPVIHVVHDTPAGAPIFTPDTPLAAEFSELAPQEGETVIHKQAPSAFTGTELDGILKKLGRNQIVLVGYMAHVCITGTARSGMEHGYDVVIVEDGVGDRDIPGVKADLLVKTVLSELADAIGTVVHSSDLAG
jgi:nicotinamidase-related amidase